MVLEAGGRVTDFEGGPFTPEAPGIVATNGGVHGMILEVLNIGGEKGGGDER
jgi:fructose-1,6-bisphosphatase/inositol monophosphatase family enzyme